MIENIKIIWTGEQPHLCECGCKYITKKGNNFINGHQNRNRKHSKEINKKKGFPGKKNVNYGGKITNNPKIRIKMKGKRNKYNWKQEQLKEKSQKMQGKNNPNYKAKYTNNLIIKEKIRKKNKDLWQTPEYVSKQMKSRGVSPNKLELSFQNLLNQLYPNEWKFVGDGQLIIAGKCPDFVNINGQKKLIELFGAYWHKGQNVEDRKKIFKEFGYETLILWEHELKDMDFVLFQLEEFIKIS